MVKYNPSASMYIGHSSRGLPAPVFYDSHTPIYNIGAPVTTITGSPGTGKSYLSKLLVAHDVMLGKSVTIIDPKSEFALAFAALEKMGYIRTTVRAWDITGVNAKQGVLDPIRIGGTKSEKTALAHGVLEVLLGKSVQEKASLLNPIVEDVVEKKNATMQDLLSELLNSKHTEARNLGHELKKYTNISVSSVLFASPRDITNITAPDLTTGVTVITLPGLELPSPGEDVSKSNNLNKRIAVAIFYLITFFVKKTLHETDVTLPKVLMIDEAHALAGSDAGSAVIRDVANMGRSKSLAMLLATQSLTHLEHLNITNAIGNRFFFKTSSEEAEMIIPKTKLPQNEGYSEIITSLQTGECLMEDWNKRYGTVQITRHNQDWNEAFETNPQELAKLKRRQAI